MNRKDFIKKSLLGATALVASPKLLAKEKDSKQSEQVGFNHLPNKEIITMNAVLHKASTRGHADHGWLKSYHSFSFANYYNPERMGFGVLRVLNDDSVAGGQGFGKHPHDNMEIISIPLAGDLEHKDSMGNTAVIKQGEVQVMSAGKGMFHSEYNKNEGLNVNFLQIWVQPNKRNVNPRYDQIPLADLKKENEFYQILSPDSDDQGVWIHQNAWFNMGEIKSGENKSYKLHNNLNGVYIFVLEGKLKIAGETLDTRDGFGIWNTDSFDLEFIEDSKVLMMEVPMMNS